MKTIIKALLFSMILFNFTSCAFDKNISCHSGSFNVIVWEDDFESLSFAEKSFSFDDHTVYFNYDNSGNVNFCFGKSFYEICPDVPAKVTYMVTTTSELQPLMISLTGITESTSVTQSSHSASTQFHGISNSLISPSTIIRDSMEVEFKDWFGERSVNTSAYLEVSFQAFNSFQEDSLYFVQHIQSILIIFEADRF